jgi:TonB family protein
VARLRSYRQTRLIEALALSLAVQGAAAGVYEFTRPEPLPILTITLDGEGDGTIQVYVDGKPDPALRCDGSALCRLITHRGAKVHMVALRTGDSTFQGWTQLPMRTPEKLRSVAGDPLASCLDIDPLDMTKHVEECDVEIGGDLDVGAGFGKVPEEVEVAWTKVPPMEQVIMPPIPPPAVPPPPIDAEKLEEDQPLEVAIVPDMPKPIELQPPTPPPPPPPPEPNAAQKPPPPPPPNMTMVEVPNQDEVEKEPDDATMLSDKNRDTTEETRATDTNLEKEQEGTSVASIESNDTTSKDIGAPEDTTHQLETSEATSDDRAEPTDHSGQSIEAKGAMTGDAGDNGDEGTGETTPGLLSMRDIAGRGAITEQGDNKKKGREGAPGLKTQLEFKDYERILGKDKTEAERQVAQRKMSAKKGRWERKLEAIKSSLENFIPDVKPGNQTALKTRAHPFALYVARMHRRIHELWGFGFLEDLDDKPADFELNDFELFVNIEVSVNPDGTVHKTTIAKTSGKLEFDVAAIDTIISAAPFEETPEAIRSVDGRVYLRWGFYRNWRQCGTFNVEPYILTEISDAEPLDDGQMVKNVPKKGTKTITPDPKNTSDKVGPTSSIKDDKALYAANLWVSGYSTGQVDKMVRFSATPFRVGTEIAAETAKDLKTIYAGLVVESGKLKDWKLVSGDEYSKTFGTPVELGDDGAIMVIETEKATFALVMQKMRSGDFRVTQLVR